MNPSGGLSLRHLMVARRLREETHPSLLIVTIREGEEQDILQCDVGRAVELVKDQVEEGSAVVIVLSKESAMWREESMKTPLHMLMLVNREWSRTQKQERKSEIRWRRAPVEAQHHPQHFWQTPGERSPRSQR